MNRSPGLEQVLDACLALLAGGEATVEDCVARYPEHATELRRALAAHAALAAARAVRPSAPFKAQARGRLVAHMRAHPRQGQPRQAGWTWGPSLRLAFGLALMALLLLSGGTALAQNALPGDALYGWKIASERAWRSVQADPLRADLALAGRRADELVRVAGDERTEPMARSGYQQALGKLARYSDEQSVETVRQSLAQQRDAITQAGLSVPELDEMLGLTPVQNPPAAETPAETTQTAPPALQATQPEVLPGLDLTSLPATLLPQLGTPAASQAPTTQPMPTATAPPADTASPLATATPSPASSPIVDLPTVEVTLPIATDLPSILP